MPDPPAVPACSLTFLRCMRAWDSNTAAPAVMLWTDYGGETHRFTFSLTDAREIRDELARCLKEEEEDDDN